MFEDVREWGVRIEEMGGWRVKGWDGFFEWVCDFFGGGVFPCQRNFE